MNFVKKTIKPKIVGVIDIGTYKIRVGICKIINRNVELIGYGEKRQDEEYVVMQELQNLEGISENITEAIKKAEKDCNIHIEIEDIIINIPNPDLFFEFSKINYIREDEKVIINDKELYEIMSTVEKQALKKHYKNIKLNSGFSKNDLKLIISYIGKVSIDNIKTKNLINKSAKEINISILNIFISETKYETIKYIEKAIGKNIIQIVPSEFAILGLFEDKKDIIIIDLGNSHTSVIVKKDNNIIGAKKLSFGINDLIKQIRKNYNLTKNDIIQTIDFDRFGKEKENFLVILEEILIITLEEILGKDICPNNFFMLGGGANRFIKKYLEKLDNSSLNILGKVVFVSPKIDFIDNKVTENPEWLDSIKSNINIFAMIKATLDFVKKDKNQIEKTLQTVVNKKH